jgi:hypothetical protein
MNLGHITSLFREAAGKLPVMRYAWFVVVVICIMALSKYFDIGDSDLLFKAGITLLALMFAVFVLSLMTEKDNKLVRFWGYLLVSVMTLAIAVYTIVLTFIHCKIALNSDIAKVEESKVLVCRSGRSYAYHKRLCNALSQCTHIIDTLTIADAIRFKHGKPCQECYLHGNRK